MDNQYTNSNVSVQREFVDIQELLKKYIKKWHWFLISTVVCIIGAFVFIQRSPVMYDVQTSILLRKDAAKGGQLSEQMMLQAIGMSGTSKDVEDEIQIIRSRTLIKEVINTLNIQTEYFEKSRWKYDELYTKSPIKLILPSSVFSDTLKNSVSFKIQPSSKKYKVKIESGSFDCQFLLDDISSPIETEFGVFRFECVAPLKEKTTYKVVTSPTGALVNRYQTEIIVAAVNKKTDAISISHVSACVSKSKDILDVLVEIYNMDAVKDKNLIAANTKSFIDGRLELIMQELSEIENVVEDYKIKNKISTDIRLQSNLLLETLTEYQKRRVALETQLNIMSYIERSMRDENKQFDFITSSFSPIENNIVEKSSTTLSDKKIKSSESLIPSSVGSDDSSLQKLIQEYNTVLIKRNRLLRTTNEQNPVIIQLEQELDIIRNNILSSVASSKEGISISLKEIVTKDTEFERLLKNAPTTEREYVELKRQQEIKEKLFVFLLQKQEETALTLASTVPSAKTIDVASDSGIPTSPKKLIILFLGLIIGLAIPVALIYMLDILNTKLDGKAELQKTVKAPFLGVIAQANTMESIVVKEDAITPIVEMFKLIRANLRFMITSKETPVVLVTSSISGEGKSFVAINLAMSLALMKKKTVLIGLDIRSPKLGNYLNLQKDNRGATLYLHDETTTLDSITQSTPMSSFLHVIPAGPIPPNPSELLTSPRLEQLFKELKKEYDYVIVDSAPISIISDTYILNRVVDNTLYVLREGYTPKELLPFVNETYQSQKLNNVAVVLNGSKEEISSYGYGNYFKTKK